MKNGINLFQNLIVIFKKLVDIVKDEKIDLTSVIPHTKNHTYLREILIVIDHNSHHTGQIIAARKIIGDWTS